MIQNSNAAWNFYLKMGEISDMDWAQHIKMDYAQNLRKDPIMANRKPIHSENIELFPLINVVKGGGGQFFVCPLYIIIKFFGGSSDEYGKVVGNWKPLKRVKNVKKPLKSLKNR